MRSCAQTVRTRRAKSFGRRVAGVCGLALSLLTALPAQAREPWLLDLEATVGSPLTKPQTRWYGVGGSLALSVQKPLASWFALTARFRTAGFLDGDKPLQAGVEDPDFGTLNVFGLGGVFRVPTGDVRRSTGLWVDAVGGGGFTGTKGRGSFEFGLGYGFLVGERSSISPLLRYVQVVQPEERLTSADAKIALLGLRVSLFDAVPPRPGERPTTTEPDRDGDGIPDATDQCIDVPEDHDQYEDSDGCPEVDNDGDGILDADDACPNIAEDKDGFQDEDGCVDDDNDRDGFLDADDQCPLEPETLNGERDDDGCPDSGLIVMQDDRIVLEERVLFDTDRAHVNNRSADAVLLAIVKLWKQHPEWKKVRIEGHADARGDESFNKTLSERRAANVRDALIKRGIEPDRIIAEGFGATQLLSQGTTDADHQVNRRVEFVVISREMPPLQPKPAEPAAPSAPPSPEPGPASSGEGAKP